MPVSARNKHIPTTLRNRVLRARDSIVADLSHKSSFTRTESTLTPSSLDRLPIIAPHVFFTTKHTAYRSPMRPDQNYSPRERRPWQILRIPTTRLRHTIVASPRRDSLMDIVWYSSVTVSLSEEGRSWVYLKVRTYRVYTAAASYIRILMHSTTVRLFKAISFVFLHRGFRVSFTAACYEWSFSETLMIMIVFLWIFPFYREN